MPPVERCVCLANNRTLGDTAGLTGIAPRVSAGSRFFSQSKRGVSRVLCFDTAREKETVQAKTNRK